MVTGFQPKNEFFITRYIRISIHYSTQARRIRSVSGKKYYACFFWLNRRTCRQKMEQLGWTEVHLSGMEEDRFWLFLVGPLGHMRKWFCVGDCLKGIGQCTLILFGLTWYQAQITSTDIMHDIRRYDIEALISELPTIILFAIFLKVLQISNNVKRMRENGEEKTIESWTYPLKMVK